MCDIQALKALIDKYRLNILLMEYLAENSKILSSPKYEH